MDEHDVNQNKRVKIICLLTYILAFILLIILIALKICDKNVVSTLDYQLPAVDEHVVTMPAEMETEPVDQTQVPDSGSNAVDHSNDNVATVVLSESVKIDCDAKKADMMFGNPSSSNVGMVLELYLDDVCVGSSGLLKPGTMIYVLEDLDLDGVTVPPKNSAYFKAINYDLETGERHVVDITSPVTVSLA